MFENLIELSNKKEILGLTDELKGLYIYKFFNESSDNVILVTSTLYEANLFFQIIYNYTNDVVLFPMDDFITSEALAISPELKTVRLESLSKLSTERKIIITNLMGYLRFLPDMSNYKNSVINIKLNDEISIDKLKKNLLNIGYVRESIVNKTGEISVRGFVIDIFPLAYENPVRIEFWGDTVDKIKVFDVNSQLSIKVINELSILPNTEFLTNNNELIDFEEIKQKNLYKYIDVVNISNFNKSIVFFNNYNDLLISHKQLFNEILEYNKSINLVDKKYMYSFDEITNHDEFYFQNFDNTIKDFINYNSKDLLYLDLNYENLSDKLNKLSKDNTIILCLPDKVRIKKIQDILDNTILTDQNNIFKNKINIINKKINSGFSINNTIVISDNDLNNRKNSNYKYISNFKVGTKIKNLDKLMIGDYVVHKLYGIGKYLGIRTLNKNGIVKDYLTILYYNDDKLYVPVEKIELVNKYTSGEVNDLKLNKLNSNDWQKTKNKVRKKIEDIAGELIKLYASREHNIGFAFDKDGDEQLKFENSFIYEDTLDQIKVTKEIKKDMESIHPMDRLLCGDVGYGKTEIAFRAIFKAIISGKQVAFLCPTTILSSQHFKNAVERFQDFAINISLLNRFTPSNDVKKIKENLLKGKIDLLIGTHRILSDDILYKDLGFLVIDEEQRFGVKHKEKIKQYKNNIDVLTLSATPIPRTLQMSMSGVRSLSLIETPPINRFPIQTYVLAENNQIIKDAVYKELARNGQIFILYNRVETIFQKKYELESLIPDAKIVVAHGKMTKNDLEKVMFDFHNKKYNILLCTTIIETGIDIPNVNTILIYNADYFGLSQLYQIRGRVGRSDKIAYAYLMYNKDKLLNEIAVKRLNAIKEFTELGSGFKIALRDLSIRGAGDILGSEQAGFINSVGIDLFLEMLKEEIDRQNGENVIVNLEQQPLIEVSTTIDDSIVLEEELKIEIHKKINEIDSFEKLENIKNELIDRFGTITNEIDIYMHEELFENMARKIGIDRTIQTNDFITLIIKEEIYNKLKVTDLFIDASNISRNFKFKMEGKNLKITLKLRGLTEHFIYYLIDLIKLFKY